MSDHEERMAAFAGRYPGRPRGLRRGQARAIVCLFLLTVLLAAVNLLFTAREVNAGEHKWCTTLELLTAHPVPRPADPAANPSRENAWIYYTDFLQLRHELGCA